MAHRSFGHRAPLLWLTLPLAAGLVLGRLLPPLPLPLLAGGMVAVAAGGLVAAWRSPTAASRLPPALALLLGGAFAFQRHDPPLGRWERAAPREVRLRVEVERTFPRDDPARTAGLARVVAAAAPSADLAGRVIYLVVPTAPAVRPLLRSAELEVSGVLTVVPAASALNTFEGYLLNAGVHFRLGHARLAAVTRPPNAYRRWLERVAQGWEAILRRGVPRAADGLGRIYRAMMLGKKSDLTPEQDTLFVETGTMHLFAINGLHVGVVALALQALGTLARLPRALSAALTLGVLWIDVQATGGSPSAVRAFLLVACHEAAFVFRLRANALAALAAASLGILLLDPAALFSASFQMSYGAVLAIVLYGVPLAEHWEAAWAPFRWLPPAGWTWWQVAVAALWRRTAAALAIGLAAALAGAITATQFYETLAPGGLPANLLFVPLAALAIIAGVVAIAVGVAGVLPASAFCNRAALVVLWAIDRLARAGVTLPAMWWPAHWRSGWLPPVALGLLLALLLEGYRRRWRNFLAGFWTPVLLVALLLAAGVRFSPRPGPGASARPSLPAASGPLLVPR